MLNNNIFYRHPSNQKGDTAQFNNKDETQEVRPLPHSPTAAISSHTTSSTPQGETVQVKSKDVIQLEGFEFDVVLEYIQFQGFALDEGLEYIIMCEYLIDNKGRTKK